MKAIKFQFLMLVAMVAPVATAEKIPKWDTANIVGEKRLFPNHNGCVFLNYQPAIQGVPTLLFKAITLGGGANLDLSRPGHGNMLLSPTGEHLLWVTKSIRPQVKFDPKHPRYDLYLLELGSGATQRVNDTPLIIEEVKAALRWSFDPKGKVLLTQEKRRLVLFDIASRQRIRIGPQPDRSFVHGFLIPNFRAIGWRHDLQPSWMPLKRNAHHYPPVNKAEFEKVKMLGAHPTENLVVYTCRRNGTEQLRVYDLDAGKVIKSIEADTDLLKGPMDCRWTANGRYLYFKGTKIIPEDIEIPEHILRINHVWDRQTDQMSSTKGGTLLGPGHTPSSMVIQDEAFVSLTRNKIAKLPMLSGSQAVVHDAATGRAFVIGGSKVIFQSAAAGVLVFSKEHGKNEKPKLYFGRIKAAAP